MGDASGGREVGPDVERADQDLDAVEAERVEVELVDDRCVGALHGLQRSGVHVPRPTDTAVVKADELDVDPASIGALPDVPGDDHALGPRHAGDAAVLAAGEKQRRPR